MLNSRKFSIKNGFDVATKLVFYGFFVCMLLIMMFTLTSSYKKIIDTSELIIKIDSLMTNADKLLLDNKFTESLSNQQSESTQTFLFTIFSIVLITIGMFVLSNIQTKYDKLEDNYNQSLDKLEKELGPKIVENIVKIVKPSIDNNNKIITMIAYISELKQNYLFYLATNDYSRLKDTLLFFRLFVIKNEIFLKNISKTLNEELFTSVYDGFHYVKVDIAERKELQSLMNDCELIHKFLNETIVLMKT